MREAAALLSGARSTGNLARVLRATGIAAEPVDVDAESMQALGIEDGSLAIVAPGVGSLRVLVVQIPGTPSLREWLQRTARSMATRAPHVLWLLAGVTADGESAALVGWTTGGHGLRLVSLVWEPARVVDSDAETLCALAAITGDNDTSVHARLVEVLGRESLTRRFYRVLEAHVDSLSHHVPGMRPDQRAVALLYASRLLFLAFLEAKGWLDGDRAFMASRFDLCMRGGGAFHQRVLLPLFFGTLNTPFGRRAAVARAFGHVPFLNGGLFTRTAVERRAGRWRFPDESLGTLLENVFQRFRFVAREDSATWSDASVDPEMLGRAFESLMESGERKAGGVFYTPHALVARVADRALEAVAGGGRAPDLRDLRVLDPACGSGAFLVYILERIADIRLARGEPGSRADIRRDVLARTVFGVDRSPIAVWLCELRLWLSVVIESPVTDPMRVAPLPNLDRNIRVGDALAGPAFATDGPLVVGNARLIQLRRRYVRATGARKDNLARVLDREERLRVVAELQRSIAITRYARQELLAARRARDLFGQRSPIDAGSKRESKMLRDRLRSQRRDLDRTRDAGALPFSFAAFFADAQNAGGFDVVLGNPPWVRLHHIPAALRQRFRRTYEVYRSAAWAPGAASARAAPGFAGQVDLAALFVERAVCLLRDGGVLSFLLPVKLWRSLAGGGVRRFLLERAAILRLEDLSESKHSFDAAVYPSLLVARKGGPAACTLTVAVHDRAPEREWRAEAAGLAYAASPGAPWLMLPPPAREAFDCVRLAGPPLALSHFGAPRLGVKSGCNSAFIVRVRDTTEKLASIVDADGVAGSVELDVLRPALRGNSVVAWRRGQCDEWILWTHQESGAPLNRLPDRARGWLASRYGRLSVRSDSRGKSWWSLFRVDAADTSRPRVVWADFGRAPRALVLPAGDPTVPLNTCYVIRCADDCDAWALTTLLNSTLAAAWLNAIAEPARGGYRRYLGWTVGLLPLPSDWKRARGILAAARCTDETTVLAAALDAYRIQYSRISDLLRPP